MRQVRPERVCEECGGFYVPNTSWQRTCSQECRRQLKNRNRERWYQRHGRILLRDQRRICRRCQTTFTPNSPSQVFCAACCLLTPAGRPRRPGVGPGNWHEHSRPSSDAAQSSSPAAAASTARLDALLAASILPRSIEAKPVPCAPSKATLRSRALWERVSRDVQAERLFDAGPESYLKKFYCRGCQRVYTPQRTNNGTVWGVLTWRFRYVGRQHFRQGAMPRPGTRRHVYQLRLCSECSGRVFILIRRGF